VPEVLLPDIGIAVNQVALGQAMPVEIQQNLAIPT
jgi:hypothetical protein